MEIKGDKKEKNYVQTKCISSMTKAKYIGTYNRHTN